jgi:diguanylate cyclase (GGDEF)-like protein
MRISLKRLGIPHTESPFGVLTISAGMSMMDPGHTRSATEVLKEADEALYRAKQLGRNRVEQPVGQPAERMRGAARVL